MVVWVAAGGRGHALRRGARGVRRELDPELADHQLPRFLAPLPGRPLHGGGPVLSRRYRRRSRPFGRACSSTRVATPRPGGLDAQRLARTPDAMSPPPALEAPTHATSIIYLEDVTVNYDGFKALSRLNFFMERRELRVVIGPNGAGKTTLLDVVSGRVKPESGRVIFGHNTDLLPLRENEIAQLGVGRKFQTPSVFVNLTVRDNVELSLRRASKGVFAALRQPDAHEERERIARTLETVQLGDTGDGKAGALSHGEKQWLEIGMMIAQDPELLLVDEPVAGLTDEETTRTGELLETIAADRSVLVIEHDMEFVRQIARKVTVLHQGTVLCEGPVEQVQRDPRDRKSVV